MTPLIKKSSKKIGLHPGALVYVGEPRTEKVTFEIIDYNEREYNATKTETVEDCFPFKDSPTVTWINVYGIHDVSVVERLGKHFGLHPLVMEDIVHAGQRAKIDEADDGTSVYIVVKMLSMRPESTDIRSEQVSIVFGENFVLCFQEQDGDIFDPIRQRVRKTVPRTRFMGGDYLAYALVDAIVDHYFLVLEQLGDRIEAAEDDLVANPASQDLEQIHALKRELIQMRKRVWPLRDAVAGFSRSESPLIHDYSRPYIRDLYEHVIQVIDTVETFREMVAGLLDLYLSSVSNKMNEVMKVLTIIATIFIPLSFLAGVYGMNFDTQSSPFNMPELGMRFGYLVFWGLALLVGGGLLWFFKRKRWM